MKRLILLCLVFLSASCSRVEQEGTVAVRFDATGVASAGTRSIVGPEDGINSLLMLFYENGTLLPQLTVNASAEGASSTSATVPLGIGHDYVVLAFANCSPSVYPATLAEAMELSYSCEGIGDWSVSGIPMSAYKSFKARYAMPPVPMQMVRLASRLDLTVDTSSLEHGSITFTSMRVRQMNCRCPFFAGGSASVEGGVCDGDIASTSDLESINSLGSGYSTSFYLLENMQGNILEGNDDPDRKIPESVAAAGADPSLCTYLEITGTYSDRSGHLTGENVVAHLYLGSDAVSNFDLVRNRHYGVTLTITDNGCLRTDWKIDGNLEDNRILRFPSGSFTIGKNSSVDVPLTTNLSLEQGDFSYSVTGDIQHFTVTHTDRGFSVRSLASVASGMQIVITATTWDGALSTSCTVRAYFQNTTRFTVDWEQDGLYLAQTGTIHVYDTGGANLEGRTLVYAPNSSVLVDGSGSTWTVKAMKPGEDLLILFVDNSVADHIPVKILIPQMRFASDRIFLPLDGGAVECGPYFYTSTGRRLYRSDFDPTLYDTLLAFDIERIHNSTVSGRYWGSNPDRGNQVVGKSATGTQFEPYRFNINALSYRGRGIGENYSFSSGDVDLEYIRAVCRVAESKITPAEATLYTADPFAGSCYLGNAYSGAPARWLKESVHDENLDFGFTDLLKAGNDPSRASAAVSVNPSRLAVSFPDRNTLRVKALYDSFGLDAMPPSSLVITPRVTNGVSGEVYESQYRFTADFTVYLSVGGVASANGSGGSGISVEWGCPRHALLSSIEDIVTSNNAAVRGLYTTLYTLSGPPATVKATAVPAYKFCDAGLYPTSTISMDKYAIPSYVTPGYDFTVWKYSRLYPESNGWL